MPKQTMPVFLCQDEIPQLLIEHSSHNNMDFEQMFTS